MVNLWKKSIKSFIGLPRSTPNLIVDNVSGNLITWARILLSKVQIKRINWMSINDEQRIQEFSTIILTNKKQLKGFEAKHLPDNLRELFTS